MLSTDKTKPRAHRPNLSNGEIAFILESLKRDKSFLEGKMARIDTLKVEIRSIRDKVYFCDPRAALTEHLEEKKAELARLESQLLAIMEEIRIYSGLIVKFEDLAEGRKNRGGRPKRVTAYAVQDLGKKYGSV